VRDELLHTSTEQVVLEPQEMTTEGGPQKIPLLWRGGRRSLTGWFDVWADTKESRRSYPLISTKW